MRLIECHIENFGNLHDETISFAADFHLIAKPNGWGKSTLATFLRVMFYGFEGEAKRSTAENERKRFSPWQGGVYGGQLTFEVNGKTYTATRIFSDKKANDTFELRDAATNLRSADFSEALGEELFAINGESFLRTVFLEQNDCVTYATDSINAKIGNITDDLNDLDCYEKADASLQEILNNLTPRRKTGRLSKVNDEITQLQTEVSQGSVLESTMRDCAEREAEAEERLCEMKQQQEDLSALVRKVSRAQDQKAKQAAYQQLKEASAQADERILQVVRQYFPGEVPTEENLRAALEACDAMDRAGERAQMYVVTQEEQEQVRAAREAALENLETLQAGRKRPRRGWIILLVCGVICALLGLVIWQISTWQWILMPVLGAALVIASLLMRRRGKQAEEKHAAMFEKMRQDLIAEHDARQEALEEKKQNYQNCQEQYQAYYSRVAEVIRRTGLLPTEPVRDQLREIWTHRVEWEQVTKDADAARKKKQEFEADHEGDNLTEDATAGLPSLEELQRMRRQSEEEAEQVSLQMDGYRRQLSMLRDKNDELMETRERLDAAQAERELLIRQFEEVGLAKEYLATAKEKMTAKYTEPLMGSFSKYYRILTGEDTGQYRMDANTRVTVEEYGVQRDMEFLSRGWQDMTGLCLRLALVDAMYREEKPFLILDDPLVNLDEEHTAGGKRLMEALAQEYQVIYFTCK